MNRYIIADHTKYFKKKCIYIKISMNIILLILGGYIFFFKNGSL